ncbi:MAG: ABC transporter ATP-binding protein [Geminicoccaceae bacterium]
MAAVMPVPGQGLEIEGLCHAFGARQVVRGVTLAIGAGEVHCLVGPSGCGKTTTLRLVAGLDRLQAGRIALGGRVLAEPGRSLPPERRRVGLMFQDFALFPHLSVAENVGFGLAGSRRRDRAARVAELLAAVNLSAYAGAYPHTLSGGEQQRVALARAMAPEPLLMLLDEAFSALDTALRAQVREETLGLLRAAGTPTLLVTHDAEEAIGVGDRIHAMQDGQVVQSGTPAELYRAPANPFVAGFFGPVSRYRGKVAHGAVATPVGTAPAPGLAEGTSVEIVVRPEALTVRAGGADGGLRARLLTRRDLGPVQLLGLRLADGSSIRIRQAGPVAAEIGQEVPLALDLRQLYLFPDQPEPAAVA